MGERRLHVRVKPSPELPASVRREVSAIVGEALEVVNMSVGGMALLHGEHAPPVGSRLKTNLTLLQVSYEIECEVRWAARGVMGVAFIAPPEETAKAIRTYVAELLERGN